MSNSSSSVLTTTTTTTNSAAIDPHEPTLEIPVWVHGKRKWVTGITKKTTFDDLIFALLAQADLLKVSQHQGLTGYAIAECLQIQPATLNSELEASSLITQRMIKGRGKVMKAHKNWIFDQYPMTVLHLIPTTSNFDTSSSSTLKFRSKIFRRFLSTKSPSTPPPILSSSQSDSSLINHQPLNSLSRQKSLNEFHENLSLIERQKRLLDYLDEKIRQAETNDLTMDEVSRLFSHRIDREDQLIFATQLCNSIFNMQERLEEKSNILYAVEQAISSELNSVLHQQHYETLPSSSAPSSTLNAAENHDLIALKNAIYRSRELSRIQSKEMHDLDLSLRELDVALASKYDLIRSLECETPSRCLTPNQQISSPSQSFRTAIDDETLDYHYSHPSHSITLIKEVDEDSGINSLTSEDSNHHSIFFNHQKGQTQLETLV